MMAATALRARENNRRRELLAQAEALAADGFAIFPVSVTPDGKKVPAIKGWPERAAWSEWRSLFSDVIFNAIGIATGKHRDGGAILAVDFDVKGEKDGRADRASLALVDKEFPPTRHHQRAGSDGFHLLYRVPAPVASSVGKIAHGIDVRSAGGFVVAYPDDGVAMVEALAWLAEAAGKPRERGERQPGVEIPAAVARGERYLKVEAPLAVEGAGGDAATFKVAAHLKDLGAAEPDAFALMADHWNERCSPPWDVAELETKVANAYRYGKEPQGSAAPETVFEAIEDPAPTAAQPWLAEMNARHAVTPHHGRYMVWQREHDYELGHDRNTWVTFEELQNRYRGKRVRVGDKSVDQGRAWLDNPAKRQFAAEAFAPGETLPANVLNLWQGFAVKTKAGAWPRMREHVAEIICDGNAAANDYLLSWLAQSLQRPGAQGEVAPVLAGEEGTGKGVFGRAVIRIAGEHGKHLTQPSHLAGKFNSHLAYCTHAFCDEALFAGDPAIRGVLFGLVTEDTLQIEKKGVDVRTAKNRLKLILASNEAHVIPAGPNSRRFFVLRVSSRRRQDTAYFAKLQSEIDGGGLSAMLHDLLARDLTGFDVRRFPSTDALTEQKLHSLKGPERWLHDALQRGALGGQVWGTTPVSVDKQLAYDDYKRAAKEFREYAPRDLSAWARAFKNALGDCWREVRPAAEGPRPRQLVLRPLPEARGAFEKFIGEKINWETDAVTTTGGDDD